jgi:hypothetical protein
VLSGTVVSAQDIAATWLMHDLDASSLSLSLMATAASAPFFLFTLPAGAIADIVNRRAVIVSAVVWQGACAALLALGAWARVVNANSLLCRRGLGDGGIRDLGGWTARDARVGARTNEFVPDRVCGHIEPVEPEFGSYQILLCLVTDFMIPTMLSIDSGTGGRTNVRRPMESYLGRHK